MQLAHPLSVHLIAIGGAVMHNMALDLQAQGHTVSGSDDVLFDPAKARLQAAGILPDALGWDVNRITPDLNAVIVGMHAKPGNPELECALALGLPVYSFPEWVYLQSQQATRVVVAGSHGKTTTTAMLMQVLAHAGQPFDYLVGSQLPGYARMVRLTGTAPLVVIEGDEYLTSPLDSRPKFLHYRPQVLIITGIAWDHANVFPTYADYEIQFAKLLDSLEDGAHVIYFAEDAALVRLVDGHRNRLHLTGYGTPNHRVAHGQTTLLPPDGAEVPLHIFGRHNLQNLEAARLALQALHMGSTTFYAGIATFTGTAKRLERIQTASGLILYRDFAHAPSKVAASVQAVVAQHPGQTVVAVLELHTFSSLSPTFVPLYRHTMAPAPLRAIVYDPETAARKAETPLDEAQIRAAFGDEDLVVLTSQEALRQYLAELATDVVVLLMSSGNLMGVDVAAL